MANNNDIIRHSDIAEDGVMKPLQDELIATIKILNSLDTEIVKIATDLKKSLGSNSFGSSEAIAKFGKQVEYSNEVLKQSNKVKEETIKTEAALTVAVSSNTKELDENRIALQNQKKANSESAKLNSDLTGAYDKLAISLAKSKREYKDLFILQQNGSTRAKELKNAIDQMEVSIRSADAAVHQHQRNVGNYGNSFNGLNNSVNQLTREMPAFANSAQTGIMAISNNLPMLADAIGDLKLKNAALVAEGKASIPIWKSVAGALFSWQTAMGVGITILTVFGKEIGEWVASLFKSSDALKLSAESQKALTKAQEDATKASIEENTKLTLLLATAKDATISYEQRKLAVDELQKTYPNYFKNLSDEKILAGDTAIAEMELRDAILAKAKAQAASAGITANELKRLEILEQREKAILQVKRAQAQYDNAASRLKADKTGRESIIIMEETARRAKNAAIDEKEALDAQLKQLDDSNKKLTDLAVQNTQKSIKLTVKGEEEKADKIAKVKKDKYKDQNQQLIDENDKYSEELRKREFEQAKDAFEANQKEFEDTFAQLEKESQLEQEAQWRADDREKQRLADLAKEKQSFLQKGFQLTRSFIDKENALKMKAIESDIQASQNRVDQLREIANKGAQNSQENLAFELRRQAELEAKRDKQIRKQIQQEKVLAILRSLGTSNPKNIGDLANSLPSFFEGTEDTGQVSNALDENGGRVAVLHDNEAVMNKKLNQKRQKAGLDLDKTVEYAIAFKNIVNPTYFDGVPMSKHVNDERQINKLDEVKSEISELKSVIKNRPIRDWEVDKTEGLIRLIQKEGDKTSITQRKSGGLFR